MASLSTKVLDEILKELIPKAKEETPEFGEVYREIYKGGSYYDGLKVKSTDFEYDLNVVFKKPKSSYHISNLGDDYRWALPLID